MYPVTGRDRQASPRMEEADRSVHNCRVLVTVTTFTLAREKVVCGYSIGLAQLIRNTSSVDIDPITISQLHFGEHEKDGGRLASLSELRPKPLFDVVVVVVVASSRSMGAICSAAFARFAPSPPSRNDAPE